MPNSIDLSLGYKHKPMCLYLIVINLDTVEFSQLMPHLKLKHTSRASYTSDPF